MLPNLFSCSVLLAQATASPLQGPTYSLADFDRDGRVDVYVVDPLAGDRLFRNLGDGSFDDVTEAAALPGLRGSRAALWQDFDGDGFEDLYVSARTGPSRLLQNTGAGAFVDVSADAGLEPSAAGELDARWLDYDLDRRPDLLLSTVAGDRFLHNLGDGRFEPVELVPRRAPADAPSAPALPPRAAEGAASVAPAPGSRSLAVETTYSRTVERARPRAPSLASPTSPPLPLVAATACADALRDASSGACGLRGSSEPELGMLYPLSLALNVDDTGHVGMGTSAPSASLHVAGLDGLLASGVHGGGGAIPASGPGTRFLWYPRKSALRAGRVDGTQWDDANVGAYSIALGQNVLASGAHSLSLGLGTVASNLYSFALGWNAQASGYGGFAIGSFAQAEGTDCYAFGDRVVATAESATAFGAHTLASGRISTAMGLFTHARSRCDTAIGTFNVGAGDEDQWLPDDPLFEVGNGSGPSERSNAFTVLKGGRVGVVTSAPRATLEVGGPGSLLASGPFGGGAPLAASGPGTRLLWQPSKAAFRVGRVLGEQWDDANVGEGSLAMGEDALASGAHSVALGMRAKATRVYGQALGWGCEATADGSTALGVFCRAKGTDSVAIGDRAVATAESSIALGVHNVASGRFSTALGLVTLAESANVTALGAFNLGGGDGARWLPGDPLFELGNGTSPLARSNALTVLKDGRVGIGTSAPQFLLEVNGSAAKPGGGSWSVASDARLKKDVRTLEGALDTLLALRGVSFEYVDPAALHELPGRRLGFIAQEVEPVLPDWVEEVGGYKRLSIRGFEALAVEALRTLQAENEALRARCAASEAELSASREELRSLSALAERVNALENAR